MTKSPIGDIYRTIFSSTSRLQGKAQSQSFEKRNFLSIFPEAWLQGNSRICCSNATATRASAQPYGIRVLASHWRGEPMLGDNYIVHCIISGSFMSEADCWRDLDWLESPAASLPFLASWGRIRRGSFGLWLPFFKFPQSAKNPPPPGTSY